FSIMARKMLINGELEKSNQEESHYDFDLFVIGAGSGGVRASRFSAQFGAKVVVWCVIRGCVPKKILVYGASFGPELELFLFEALLYSKPILFSQTLKFISCEIYNFWVRLDARNYGWELNEKIDFNWKKLLQKKTEEIIRLNGIYKRLLSNAGVKLYEGEGKVVGPNEVEVTQLDGTKICYSAKHILIATGGRAQRAAIPGQVIFQFYLEGSIVSSMLFSYSVLISVVTMFSCCIVGVSYNSDEALSLDELPKRAVYLGEGLSLSLPYIAVEFASIWRGMGCTVDLFFRKELPLRTSLTELVKTEEGIKVVTDHGEEIMADVVLLPPNHVLYQFMNLLVACCKVHIFFYGAIWRSSFLDSEVFLFITGRVPNTKRLNLEAVDVELDKTGAIKVDEYSRTNIPSIWAIGDVTNRMNLTPVALMEGTLFAVRAHLDLQCNFIFLNVSLLCVACRKLFLVGSLANQTIAIYLVPSSVNNLCLLLLRSIPPLSVVGLSEEQAIEQAKGDVLVFTSTFNPMKNTVSGRQEKTIMKLVVDRRQIKFLEHPCVGRMRLRLCRSHALILLGYPSQGIAIALKCGATKAQFDSTVGIHPSAAEEFVTMRSVTRRLTKPKTNL
ncbi:hypothetical protein C3L33_15167, partial [Rhododendron williamsianum]